MPLTNYEKDVLRHLNGESVADINWDSATSFTLSHLKIKGLVTLRIRPGVLAFEITDEGRAAIR